jgi:hypothetical protein
MAKGDTGEITPGQRYEQRGGFNWKVVRLITFPGEGVRHVQLVSERDPSSTKTLSVNALLDRGMFRLLDES